MPKHWINLDEIRHAVAAKAKEIAEDGGLENVHVHVRVEAPDARGRRVIAVEVTPLGIRDAEMLQGRKWQDN